jgi:bacterioferritin
MAVYDSAEVARLLNQDLYGEHDAIAHYLQHAWALAESYGPAIEGIARDEMRHLKWLAHTIVELGGVPDLAVPPVTPPPSGRDLFASDIVAEEQAIQQYQAHRQVIRHPRVEGLLGRILVDEQDHRRQFLEMLKSYQGETWHMTADVQLDPVADKLQRVIAIEYQAVLQSLWRSFLHRAAGSLAADWEERAIDEMKHLGWMGEALASRGVWAQFPERVELTTPPADQEARETALYQELLTWAIEEAPDWVPLLERIRQREAYHQVSLDRGTGGFTLGPLVAGEGRQ